MPRSGPIRLPATATLVAVTLGIAAAGCSREAPQQTPASSEQPDKPAVTSSAAAATAAPAPAAQPPAAAPAAQPPAAAPAANADPCSPICERTVKLGCGPRDACLTACAQVNDGSVCGTEMSAFMSCALTHPVEHWECTENGVAAIREGYCDAQQQAFMRCFQTATN